MNQNALLLAVAGGFVVWWLYRRSQSPATMPQPGAVQLPPPGSFRTADTPPGTYRDPSGALLFAPDAPEPVDWT